MSGAIDRENILLVELPYKITRRLPRQDRNTMVPSFGDLLRSQGVKLCFGCTIESRAGRFVNSRF